MKTKRKLEKEINIPEGIEISSDGIIFKVKGPKGTIVKKIYHPEIDLNINGNKINLKPKDKRTNKNYKTLIGTFRAHLLNMINGVQNGYEYKLKVCSGHFPMSVGVEGHKILIKNFMGEKVPRKAGIIDGVSVQVSGDIITVTGLDKEVVSQTAARIEQATKITNRDRRVFQDGCYLISKAGKKI